MDKLFCFWFRVNCTELFADYFDYFLFAWQRNRMNASNQFL